MIIYGVILHVVYCSICMQLLQELSQVPCTADINFAQKASIMKKNRYKDRFPCESLSHTHLVNTQW